MVSLQYHINRNEQRAGELTGVSEGDGRHIGVHVKDLSDLGGRLDDADVAEVALLRSFRHVVDMLAHTIAWLFCLGRSITNRAISLRSMRPCFPFGSKDNQSTPKLTFALSAGLKSSTVSMDPVGVP